MDDLKIVTDLGEYRIFTFLLPNIGYITQAWKVNPGTLMIKEYGSRIQETAMDNHLRMVKEYGESI